MYKSITALEHNEKKSSNPSLPCRACAATKTSPRKHNIMNDQRITKINTSNKTGAMESRHRRALSPGSHRISNPARSSAGMLDIYDDGYYARDPRDYKSSHIESTYGPSPRNSGSSVIGSYSGRPRRGTYDRNDQGGSRSHRDDHKPRGEHRKVYKVDDTYGARLVGEREVLRGLADPERVPRARDYAYKGSSSRPREVNTDEYSYTDAVGMYRDTEPRRLRRRGSVDREPRHNRWGSQDSYDIPSRASTKDYSRQPMPRAVDRLNDGLRRHETLDERTFSKDRSTRPDRSYTQDDHVAHGSARGARPSSMVDFDYDDHLPQYRSSASRPYAAGSDDDDFGPRRSRGKFKDEQIQTRGFGIRSASAAPSDISPERKILLAIEPPPRRPTADVYGPDGVLMPPDPHDYMPRASLEQEEKRRELERTEKQRRRASDKAPQRYEDYDYEDDDRLQYDRPEKPYSRAQDGNLPPSDRDRDREDKRGYERDYERDTAAEDRDYRDADYERRHERESIKNRARNSRYDDETQNDDAYYDADHRRHVKNAAVATVGAGATAYAVHRGVEDKEKHRERRTKDETNGLEAPKSHERGLSRDVPRERTESRDHEREREKNRIRDHEDYGTNRDDLNDRHVDRDLLPRNRASSPSNRDPSKRDRNESRDSSLDPVKDVPRNANVAAVTDSRRADGDRGLPRDTDALPLDVHDHKHQDQASPRSIDSLDGADDRGSREHRVDHRDHERSRRRRDRDDDDIRGTSRREPSVREDKGEREYDDRDRESRRRGTRSEEEEAAEDYRRRVLESQKELDSFAMAPPPPGSFPAEQSTEQRREILGDGVVDEPLQLEDNDGREREKSRVRIVEPPKKEEVVAPVKGILRKPTDKFPDHPNAVREGALPLKEEAAKRGIPSDARWTKIKRSLVNPEALIQAKERFEERLDYVIILRVLSKDEVQKLADLTAAIRRKRDEDYDRERETKRSSRRKDDDFDESDDDAAEDHDARRRHNDKPKVVDDTEKDAKRRRDNERDRDTEREKDNHSHSHRDRDRDLDRDRERSERERDSHRDKERERDRARD